MTHIEDKEQLISLLVSRVVERAPVKELIRVYCEALTASIRELDDADLIQRILEAGHTDLIEQFNLADLAVDLD